MCCLYEKDGEMIETTIEKDVFAMWEAIADRTHTVRCATGKTSTL